MNVDIPFSFGQNNKLPAVTGREFFATLAQNLSPEDGHFKSIAMVENIYTTTETLNKFAYTFDPATRVSDLYGFGPSGAWSLGKTKSKIYSDSSSTTPFAAVQWKNVVYFTRPGVPIRRAQGATTIQVSTTNQGGGISAKYAVAAHDKLFLANVTENGTMKSTTVRWSDLYNPENFNVTETTEADSFQLSVDDLEITGLALHRNQVLIFTYNSIWTAHYEGLPGVYNFSPLYGGVGCSYHYSVLRVQDMVYFISTSGVYKIDSFQLVEVGAQIWPSLSADLAMQEEVHASVDEIRKLIYWNVGSKTYVFNYVENRWAVYNFNYCGALITLPGNLKSTAVIDEITVPFSSLSSTKIDAGYGSAPLALAQQLISRSGEVLALNTTNGTIRSYHVTIDLPPAFIDSIWSEKELTSAKLLYKRVGAPAVTLTAKMQDSLTDTIVSESVTLNQTSHADESQFFTRNVKVGKLLGLTISYQNYPTNYVTQLIGLSLNFLDAATDAER